MKKKCEQAHTPYAPPLLDNAIYTERMAALNTQNNLLKTSKTPKQLSYQTSCKLCTSTLLSSKTRF